MSTRLDRLRRLLRRREDAAAAQKARTARAVSAAEEDVAHARDAQAAVAAPEGTLRAAELQGLRLRALGAAAGVERASEVLADRRAADGEAEEARTVAAVRRRSVERLAERRETVAVRAAAAVSQRALDDLAVLRRAHRPGGAPGGPQGGQR